MTYQEWLKDFTRDKKLVGLFDQSIVDAVHDVHRYVDNHGDLWETAVTYTGHVVVRAGILQADAATVDWNSWQILPDIQLSTDR